MATDPKPFISPEEYLRIERAAPIKSEYSNGQMYAMAGGTLNHSRIATNLVYELEGGLRSTSCHVFTSDLRVHIPATGLYTYPDVSVVCGAPELQEGQDDVLINPILLVEVLSPSSRNYDRGDKFGQYRSISSFREYLIVEQTHVLIEQWSVRDGHWTLTEYKSVKDRIGLLFVPAIITVGDIYFGVEF